MAPELATGSFRRSLVLCFLGTAAGFGERSFRSSNCSECFHCSRLSCRGQWLRGDSVRVLHFMAGSCCGKYRSFLTAVCVLLQSGLVTVCGLESVPLCGHPPFSAESSTAQGSSKVVVARSLPAEGLLRSGGPPGCLAFLFFLETSLPVRERESFSLPSFSRRGRGRTGGGRLLGPRAAPRPLTCETAVF